VKSCHCQQHIQELIKTETQTGRGTHGSVICALFVDEKLVKIGSSQNFNKRQGCCEKKHGIDKFQLLILHFVDGNNPPEMDAKRKENSPS